MTIKREDLIAAASAGVLQYKQIDPMLVFLMQRDIKSKRDTEVRQTRTPHHTGRHVMLIMLGILAIVGGALMAGMHGLISLSAIGPERMPWVIGVYAVFTLAVAAWSERRRIGSKIRFFLTSVLALLPLAMFVSQHLKAV